MVLFIAEVEAECRLFLEISGNQNKCSRNVLVRIVAFMRYFLRMQYNTVDKVQQMYFKLLQNIILVNNSGGSKNVYVYLTAC